MAKQKLKNPGRRTLRGADNEQGAFGSSGPGLGKGRDKSKARPAGKNRLLKRPDKGKKTLRKDALLETATASGPSGQPAEATARQARRPLLHKITRPKLRLGPLERLQLAVEEVRHGGRASARTRKLQMSGLPKMAQKVIEEAGEIAIEAVLGNRAALINETADLFYNLVVLMTAAGIPLDAVWSEMERREASLGMAEKLPKPPEAEA